MWFVWSAEPGAFTMANSSSKLVQHALISIWILKQLVLVALPTYIALQPYKELTIIILQVIKNARLFKLG